MTIRASDLPAHIRARLPQPPPRRKRPAEARDEAPSGRGCRWRCAACGHVSEWWTGARGAQTHADEHGHHRIDVVWGEGEAE